MNEAIREAVAHGPDCPPLARLLDSPGLFQAHLDDCAACQSEVALFEHFDDVSANAQETAVVRSIVSQLRRTSVERKPSVWSRFLHPAWFGAAAMAAAAVILAVGLGSHPSRQPAAPDVLESVEQMRSRSVSITSPHGDVDRLPQQVDWAAVAGASEYVVTLTEVDGTVIVHRNVTSSSFTIPSSTYTLVNSGKAIRLNVRARNTSGMEVANSGTIILHVLPKKFAPKQ